jgi:hypothetical protein
MIRQHILLSASCVLVSLGTFACSSASDSRSSAGGSASPSGSEVAVSVVSGALNNNSGSIVALASPPRAPKRTIVERAFSLLNPIGTAYAATWTCTGDTLTPKFAGTGDYAYLPASCSVMWLNGKTASSTWSGPFTLDYGASCNTSYAFMEKQDASCEMTRTSAANGDTRTITGPDGNSYAIDHDTNGAGTGWDSSVSPAPTDDGVQITCGTGGCAATRNLVVSGSHLTGTVTIDGDSTTIWNHTVSTGEGGISVAGAGASRVVSGSVTVQHNLIKATSTTTFASVGYGEPGCCFPTSGEVSTTFSKGTSVGKTETLTFSDICGEATLTEANGTVESITLEHCL